MVERIEELWRGGAVLGEGPLWDEERDCLYWLDIKGYWLHRLCKGVVRSWRTSALPTCLGLERDGALVGAIGLNLARLDLAGDQVRATALTALPAAPHWMRFNDGKVAPDGSFWIGTMDDREQTTEGGWWRFEPGATPTLLAGGFGVANGPAFDATHDRTFVTDSAAGKIFRVDARSSAKVSLTLLKQFEPAEDGYPDGMCVDRSGHLWVAFWDGGCIRALDPVSGQTLRQVELPCRRPTCCAFGGPDLDILYVTSARIGLDEPRAEDGSLFSISGLGVSGVPSHRFGL